MRTPSPWSMSRPLSFKELVFLHSIFLACTSNANEQNELLPNADDGNANRTNDFKSIYRANVGCKIRLLSYIVSQHLIFIPAWNFFEAISKRKKPLL